MGHVHFVRLPLTPPWRTVVRQLQGPSVSAGSIANATAIAAAERLDRLRDDASLVYCFWLLSRLASAARRPDFIDGLDEVGLRVASSDTAVAFISRVAELSRRELERHPESGPFGEFASLSLRRALTETVGAEGQSLFGSSLDDLERALAKHATPKRFAEIVRRFFGDVLSRTLRFYVEKELSLYVGPGWGLASTAHADAFVGDLDRYARQTAAIVETFAGEWFDLHDFRTGGRIGRDEAQGFVAEALRKIRGELDGAVA
jgi:hypothetical protein